MHHKTLATRLSAQLHAHPFNLKRGHALECVAALHGLPNWDTLAARPRTAMLPPARAALALRGALDRYGCPLSEAAVHTLLATLLTKDVPPPSSPRTLSVWRGLQVLPGSETTLSPWPLLPLAADVEHRATKRLSDATHLSWVRGKGIKSNGAHVPATGLVDEGTQLGAWAAALLAAAPGTSHRLTVQREGAEVTRVDLRRGMKAAPTPEWFVHDSELNVVYGPPRSDLARQTLALAYARAQRGTVFLVDTPALLGRAGPALAGPCHLLPDTPAGVQDLRARAHWHHWVVLSAQADNVAAYCEAAMQTEARVIIAVHASTLNVDGLLQHLPLSDEEVDYYEVGDRGQVISRHGVRSELESDTDDW
ncbi:hypothetical protein K7W42_18365 [Deinococcus sp. HMF7604]|uniref:hypothetical protein n=1 Tax=Deinococcus betulae TaxID=2873312 RepID=UPI001CCB1995|nr:hypothetical protein [Deinococcus betulae]MBZ9752808.1 hypothetical protein [Deinococcus betulae]